MFPVSLNSLNRVNLNYVYIGAKKIKVYKTCMNFIG